MSGPRWAPPGKVARTCHRDGWGMCDLCDQWADLTTAEDDQNFAFCEPCTERLRRDELKDRLKRGHAPRDGGDGR